MIRFLRPDGSAREAEPLDGDRLLDLAQRVGEPLEGTCGGVIACGTCHVAVEGGFDRLPPASAEEEELLDLLPGARRTSRLSCQVRLSPALDGLAVRSIA